MPSDVFQVGTVWVNKNPDRPMNLKVVERSPGRSRAVLASGKELGMVREDSGDVRDNTVTWRGSDIRVLKGPQVAAKGQRLVNQGTIHGDEIAVSVSGNGRQ